MLIICLSLIKHDGLFCLWNLLDLSINHFMPPKHLMEDVGYIFRKEASIPQIAQWKKTHGNSCSWRANPNKSMVFGRNKFNPMAKEIASDCNYTNASTNTGHGARRCGISAVGNFGAGPSTVKTFTRYTNLNQSTTYHESNEEDRMVAAVAVQGLNKANNTANVGDDDGYNNVDDDDDQPTHRQNQPSQRGRHPNPSSHNNLSITSPHRKRSKSRPHSSAGSRSPDSRTSSCDSRRHHHHVLHPSLPPHHLYQPQTRSLSPVTHNKCYYV